VKTRGSEQRLSNNIKPCALYRFSQNWKNAARARGLGTKPYIFIFSGQKRTSLIRLLNVKETYKRKWPSGCLWPPVRLGPPARAFELLIRVFFHTSSSSSLKRVKTRGIRTTTVEEYQTLCALSFFRKSGKTPRPRAD